MRIALIVLLTLLTSLSSLQVYGTVIPVTPYRFYTPAGSTPANVVGTSASVTAGSNPTSPDIDLLKRGVITLGIDQHYARTTAEFDLTVNFEVKKWAIIGGDSITQNASLTISYKPSVGISYNDKQLLEVTDALRYKVKITSISYTPSGGSPAAQNYLPANVYMDLELFVDRLYDFRDQVDQTVDFVDFEEDSNVLDKDCDSIKDVVLLQWLPIQGAEEYQLEWTFVNDYTESATDFKDDADIWFDFRHNSTRILTSGSSYEISMIYPHGYLIYRIRAVGRLWDKPTKRVYTAWTTPDVGNVADDANHFYPVTQEWEVGMNWQYSSSFAEQGKKKEVVSFYDGSLRNRQMVTLTNTNNKAIVGETIYDNLGRPSVQVLPAPVLSNACTANGKGTLKYYEAFNQNSEGDSYSSLDFGYETSNSCEATADVMGTGSGASKYYSSANTNNTGIKGYIPDAGGYPFSQVEYMADNTGRVKRQGGVGNEFQLDPTDHNTKYFYGHPSQIELDRMFGSEVGDYMHYQKNMVIDPNGQTSVSYLDQEGRVIATALAGETPSNVASLTSAATASVTLTDDYILPGSLSNTLSADGLSRSFVSSILVSSQTNITLNYGLEVLPYTESCLEEGICFGCVYDLTIDFISDCGESMLDSIEQVDHKLTGHFTTVSDSVVFELDCNAELANASYNILLEQVPAGSYQLIKTLTLNDSALAYYTAQYQDTNVNTCYKTLEDFQLEYLENIDLSGCNPDPTDCEACLDQLGDPTSFVANGGTLEDWNYLKEQCELPCKPQSLSKNYQNLLLSDVRPHGQYGEYLSNGGVHPESFPLSVYNPNTQLPGYFGLGSPFWKKPKYEKGGVAYTHYYEENLQTESAVELSDVVLTGDVITSSNPAIVNGALSYYTYDSLTETYFTAPENLANVADFIANFKPSWAYSLICYHPEYSYYKTYAELGLTDVNGKSSDWFDDLMANADTWNEAVAVGLIKSNYASISTPVDRLAVFNSLGSPIYDPFAASGDWTSYTDDVVTYQGSYHLAQVAAMMTRCNGIGATPDPSCLRFGDNVSGAGVGDTSAVNRAARDTDWQNFKGIYRSLKQQYIANLAQQRALADGNYYGYNGCIGNQDFNPFLNGFFAIFSGPSQFSNSDQPCYAGTALLYKYKARRFNPPAPINAATTNPYTSFNETAALQYELTGNCPAFTSISSIISGLNGLDNLDGTGLHLNAVVNAPYTSYLLSQNLIALPVGGTAPDYTWNASVSGATLDVEIKNGATVVEEVSLVQQTGTPIAWDQIVSIFN